MKSILVIEDDPAILLGIESALEDEYEVLTASDGEVGFYLAKKKSPDLIILDLMLPNKNGYDICKEVRKNGINIPIIVLTAKKEENDKIKGFEVGADDYVTKPFSAAELLLRVKAHLRRSNTLNEKQDIKEFSFDNILVDFKKLDAFKDGTPLNFSVKEFQILKFFIEREGEVVSRTELLDNVWGYDVYPTTRTVDNYILSIRKKIEKNPASPEHLVTIHTLGYKFLI